MADYDRPHIDVTALLTAHPYKAHQSPGGRVFLRNREQHGTRLSTGLAASFEAAEARRPTPEALPPGVEPGEGAFVTVTLDPAAKEIDIEKPDRGIRQSAAGEDAGKRTMVLHVRDKDAQEYLAERVERYRSGELTAKGSPPLASQMQPIEDFSPTELVDLWREDPAALPQEEGTSSWWGLWCWADFSDDVTSLARAFDMQIAPEDRWSTFPDICVVPVHATREQIQALLDLGQPGLAEIGFASDDPAILVSLSGQEQDGLVNDLAGRILWPGTNVPAVCLLDTGVNRAHPLIEPALSPRDAQAIEEDWGADDHDRPGHGTPMAGLALHGDLTGPLADSSTRELRHRLESVKILPPSLRAEDDPANYGAIMQAAVALAEERNPDRLRTICSAVTNMRRRGDRPSRWSAAIDGIAAGVDADDNEEPPRRLFVQAIGNVGHDNDWSAIEDPTLHPGEDPAQSWNALTVGGVTFKDEIETHERGEWLACAEVGEVSPYGRTTCDWPDGTTPIKPEIVFEAGNRAVNAFGDQVTDAMPSLSLVSTGKGGTGDAIVPFHATSAATAQAARMAARIMAERADYWPETVRALMVHSARWTPPMLSEIDAAGGKTGRSALRRKFGYGMPDLPRALASSSNDLALLAQAYIQPFDRPAVSRRDPDRRVGRITFGNAHYYDLPWPTRELEQLENCLVRLKVTLSYFVEPYPLKGSMLDPARYRSFGLRFDLKRQRETVAEFKRRRNAEMGDKMFGGEDDPRWDFGPKAIAAGSLHCDTWTGTAVELASRDQLAIYPVMGWWRDRPGQGRYLNKARYALVVTLEAPEAGIDLQAQVAVTARAMIATKTGVPIGVSTGPD
ncbi:MAG: S8 family peptidase [Rhizobiaceae bacterium]|nr:S8 family peptidase [Rhizobiaceae bacterium]